jgi:hypothetical protein
MLIRRTHFLVVLVAGLLTACGGGGDSGGTAMPTGAATSATGGSISSSAPALTSTGSISAFGSVFINGNHFNVDGAQITVDDNPATEQDMQVGQSATVAAMAAVGANLAIATSVAIHSQVIGSVTSVNTSGNSFVVLGQTVRVGNETSFDQAISPADITGIHAADLVAVHGAVAADGSITARRISRATAALGLLVAGTVANVNTTSHTFTLNALTVNYTSATLSGFSSGAPANGDAVRIRGTVFTAASSTLTATAVARIPAPPVGAASAMVEVEGLVTRFASLTDFDVAGQKVTTTAATRYVNGVSADIALNGNVEVHGTMNSAGVLTATVIDVHNNSIYGLNAPVTALNATTSSLTVLGVSITVNDLTRREDLSSTHVRNFAFGDLRIGDNVAVMGYEKPVGSGQVVATMLTRLPAGSSVNVSGPFTATTAPQFKVLGVTVNAASATFFADRNTTLTSAQFFAQAAGRQVAVTGTGGAPLVASRVLLLPVDLH